MLARTQILRMARHARTLHMWTQVVGKIRLQQTPLVNHWWNVPLYVSARGLTTSAMPYEDRIFEIEFDFIDHKLLIKCSDGSATTLASAAADSRGLLRGSDVGAAWSGNRD